MKPGDRIRVEWNNGLFSETEDYTIEEFHHCLGFFRSKQDRQASNFTPLCNLLEPGPDSKDDYISNYGEYKTNLVQGWMDLSKEES